MVLGAGSHSLETITSVFEWDLMGLREIFESSSDDEKSPLISSNCFGGGKWQLHFYASAARAQSCSLYLAAVPTPEELRLGAAQLLCQGGLPKENTPSWFRRGPFKFTFEIKSLDGTIPIVARGPHEPMIRREFSNNVSTWGYPQYVRRTEIYGDRAIAKANDGVKIICTLTTTISSTNTHVSPPPPQQTVPDDLVDVLSDFFDNPRYSDVVFRFPVLAGTGEERRIFANKAILSRRSSYFRDLFHGGFSEGNDLPSTSLPPGSFSVNEPRVPPGPPLTHIYSTSSMTPELPSLNTDDDSESDSDYSADSISLASDTSADDEEEMEVEIHVNGAHSEEEGHFIGKPMLPIEHKYNPILPILKDLPNEHLRSTTPDSTHSDDDYSHCDIAPAALDVMHPIMVSDESYSTYKAMLYSLYTDHISFAPLSSTYEAEQASKRQGNVDLPFQSRREYIKARVPQPARDVERNAPFPVSPKAMYKLADKMGLQRLKERSFEAIKLSLNPKNIVQELFGSFASLFPEVQAAETEYLLTNWDSVAQSDALTHDLNPFSDLEGDWRRAKIGPNKSPYRRQYKNSSRNRDLFTTLLQSLRPRGRRDVCYDRPRLTNPHRRLGTYPAPTFGDPVDHGLWVHEPF